MRRLHAAITPQGQPLTDLRIGDCRQVLPLLATASVHLVLTDPPYFLDGLDNRWRKGAHKPSPTGTVGGLPVGMRFDPQQGRRLQAFLYPIAGQCLRVLRPGGFLLMFAAPRLAHRAAVALEDAGFEIRESLVWHFRGRAQMKAFAMTHLVRRRTDLTDAAKQQLIRQLDGWRTPQPRPQHESIVLAQKPRDGTFVENWCRHGVGLMDARQRLHGCMVSTVLPWEKESVRGHLTPKPVALFEYLIRLFTSRGQSVLDPFIGSGTTALAARNTGRRCIGIDINADYIRATQARLESQ